MQSNELSHAADHLLIANITPPLYFPFNAISAVPREMAIKIRMGDSCGDLCSEVDFSGNPEEDEVDWLFCVGFVWNLL